MKIKTLARLCGQRWPRLLPPAFAASYCGLYRGEEELTKFPQLMAAKIMINGREKYDRFELDRILDELKSSGEFCPKY